VQEYDYVRRGPRWVCSRPSSYDVDDIRDQLALGLANPLLLAYRHYRQLTRGPSEPLLSISEPDPNLWPKCRLPLPLHWANI